MQLIAKDFMVVVGAVAFAAPVLIVVVVVVCTVSAAVAGDNAKHTATQAIAT